MVTVLNPRYHALQLGLKIEIDQTIFIPISLMIWDPDLL